MEQLLMLIGWLVAIAVVVTILLRSVRVIRQQQVGVVERLGKFRRTLEPGPHLLVPVIDTVRYTMDMREAVVPFPPQGVITEDNLMVSIDSVIYFQVTDPKAATYEIANYIQAIEQLTVTTLRNVIGGMDLEQILTSREDINSQLRGVLDEATGKWGIRVNRVELKAIDPPRSVQESMEKQMRAERDKRAAILNAEGTKQAAILAAEGQKQSAILTAEGQAQAARIRAEGEAAAVRTTFTAIHEADPDPKLLAYTYLQQLPRIANGQASKVWVVPAEMSSLLATFGAAFQNNDEAKQSAPSSSTAKASTPVNNDGPVAAEG